MKINKIIDQTNIRKTASSRDIRKTCQEARKYDFRGVCVRPKWVKLVKKELAGTEIKTICLIDPPIGHSPSSLRLAIAKKAKKDGADELDVVVSLVDVKNERWKKIFNDLKKICRILPTKVIIGSGYLTDQEIETVCQIAKKAGAFCVKTATEKDPLGPHEIEEKIRHLKIMKKSAPGLLIKASGYIQTLKDLKKVIQAGADIIGTSFGVEIIKEIRK
ncbi:MAG: deoxyribose-phosphate aldolase [Patescibacteria group bacterium]|nr:deoxyribose-phosphate aldolase [Patescibacteria group bacterium]